MINQEINIQNMNVELIAQMFKNYRSNVLFHLEGKCSTRNISHPRKSLSSYIQQLTAFTLQRNQGTILGNQDMSVTKQLQFLETRTIK